jgi:hypothetical protein
MSHPPVPRNSDGRDDRAAAAAYECIVIFSARAGLAWYTQLEADTADRTSRKSPPVTVASIDGSMRLR